jgi:type IV pilus assembly protein PilB
MGNNRRRLGEVLVAAGVLTQSQLRTALAYQQTNGGRLAEVIILLGLASEQKLMQALSAQLGIPWKKVGDLRVPDAVLNLVPRPLIERHGVLPLQAKSGMPWPKLLVAMAEPQNLKLVDEIAFASGHSIYPVLASRPDLERAFRTNGIYGVKELARSLELDDVDAGEEFVVVRDGSIFA